MVFQIGRVVAMITGGGRGLGRATAQLFVKHGGKVTILDLPDSDAEEVADGLGDNCTFCPCDVTNAEEVADAIELTTTRFGGLHVLVNCAGTSVTRAIYNLGQDDPHRYDVFEEVLESNVTGTFNAIRLAVPEMVKNTPDEDGQCGVIINTSSISAYDGERGQLAYSASKAATNAMTLPLSRDLARAGIRVNTISPGIFRTPLLKRVPEKILEFLASQTPFPRRLGHSEEFSAMVQTIVENSYINGEIIRLDGAIRPAGA